MGDFHLHNITSLAFKGSWTVNSLDEAVLLVKWSEKKSIMYNLFLSSCRKRF